VGAGFSQLLQLGQRSWKRTGTGQELPFFAFLLWSNLIMVRNNFAEASSLRAISHSSFRSNLRLLVKSQLLFFEHCR